MLSATEIAEIIYEHPLSEEEAQKLIHKEIIGRRREDVLGLLCAHARKARATRVMQRALVQGIRLQSVTSLSGLIGKIDI